MFCYIESPRVDVYTRLPILVQPEFIRKALSAGKHVLSEKPIAKDLATAQELVQWYHSNVDTKKVFWGVAENFRFYNSFTFAAEQVRKLGRVQNFRVNSHFTMKPESRYYRMYLPSIRMSGSSSVQDF